MLKFPEHYSTDIPIVVVRNSEEKFRILRTTSAWFDTATVILKYCMTASDLRRRERMCLTPVAWIETGCCKESVEMSGNVCPVFFFRILAKGVVES